MYAAVVLEGASFGVSEAIALALIEIRTFRTSLTISLSHGVGDSILVGPSDRGADFDGDVSWAEGVTGNRHFVGGGWRRRSGTLVGAV